MLEVYVTDGACSACSWTLKILERVGLTPTVHNVSELGEEELSSLKKEGHFRAPLVRSSLGTFSGPMTPAQAKQLAAAL